MASGSLDLFDLRTWLTRPRADYSGCELLCIGSYTAQLCIAGRTSIMHAAFGCERHHWASCSTLCNLVRPNTVHALDCLDTYTYIHTRPFVHVYLWLHPHIFLRLLYMFELGIRVFLHALIHMLSIHSDGVLLFDCIVCSYGSFHALLQ